MDFDVRWPIGLLFGLLGLLLAGYGAASGSGLDLGWGAVLTLFGAAMLLLAARARRR